MQYRNTALINWRRLVTLFDHVNFYQLYPGFVCQIYLHRKIMKKYYFSKYKHGAAALMELMLALCSNVSSRLKLVCKHLQQNTDIAS